MDISLHTFLIICPFVFLAGLVDSIAGGGGLISLPAYFISGLPTHNAIATNKLSSCIGTAIATFRYGKNKQMDWKLGVPSVLFALIGSTIGANLVLLVNDRIMKYLLVLILPVVAYYVLRGRSFSEETSVPLISRKKVYIIAIAASFIIGTYDGFYGPGTGTFLILAYNGLAKMDIKIAAGNTKLINLSSNIAAVVTFLLHGKIVILLGLTAACFSVAGNYIGAGLVLKNGYKIIRPIIIFVLILLFVKVIMG